MTGRHTVITKSVTSNVLNSLRHGARQTVRGIVLWNYIAVASALLVLTEHIYRISGFSVIWSAFVWMVCTLGRSETVTIALTPLLPADVTFATSECSYIQVMLFVCPLRSAECSHMIDILHVERNKIDVSSHVTLSWDLFLVPYNLRFLNSLWTALIHRPIRYVKTWESSRVNDFDQFEQRSRVYNAVRYKRGFTTLQWSCSVLCWRLEND